MDAAPTLTDDQVSESATKFNPKILREIATDLTSSMPDVQQHAIDAANQKSAEEQAQNQAASDSVSDITDAQGRSFDSSIHRTDEHGTPQLTKGGKLSVRRGKGASTSRVGSVKSTLSTEEIELQKLKVQAQVTGKVAANLLLTIGVTAGGEEWKPVTDQVHGIDERVMLESAFADYFETTGQTDLPPSFALLIAVGGYALPRFTMPKTQSRLSKFKAWIKRKIADRRLRKHGLKAVADTDTT